MTTNRKLRSRRWLVCDICSREFFTPDDRYRDKDDKRTLPSEVGLRRYSDRGEYFMQVCPDCCSELSY